MSHELRTPLNAILGFSELLRSDTFHSHRAEYAKLIYDAGAHLLTLVEDIHDLAKIDTGTLALSEKRFDFAGLAREVADLAQETADSAGVALTLDIAKSLPDIHCDETALRQVLLNLASNALKVTPPGGKVSVFARVEASGEFVLGVRDTGIGIPDEDQGSVFDSFGRGCHEPVTGDKGSGLGLPIAKAACMGRSCHPSPRLPW
jgi:two-component system cell cycle sensor histidine kinase PleC